MSPAQRNAGTCLLQILHCFYPEYKVVSWHDLKCEHLECAMKSIVMKH